MNNFDDLAKLALDEASLGDYMRAAKTAGRAIATGAARTAQAAGKIASLAGGAYSLVGGTQGGALLKGAGNAVANAAGNVAKSMKELGATAQEEAILKKLYGENPKKGDPINVELPGIKAPSAKISSVKPGPNNSTIYTIDLSPIIGNLAADTSATLGGGGQRLQNQQKAAKAKLPIDQISFTKGNGEYGSTNVKLSMYKDGKLVAARNIPGLKDSGGLHFNGTGKPWTLNLDSSDSIDFTDIAAFIASDKSLNLAPDQMKQVAAARDYPQLKQILVKFGKGDLFIKVYTNAVTALRQGKPVPNIPQSTGNSTQQTATGTNNTANSNTTTGVNARTADGNPVPGQTRFTTADKKKTYMFGRNGWMIQDPNNNNQWTAVKQQAQITAAWQKSQNITPTAKPAAAPSKKAARAASQTKAGVPVEQPTAADLNSMNLPTHPLTSKTPANVRR